MRRLLFPCIIILLSSFFVTSCKKDQTPEPQKHEGPDVYITGYSSQPEDGNFGDVPTYWKNGKRVVLDGAAATANAIAISGNDIYVIGNTGYDRQDAGHAVYWKNENIVKLSNDQSYATAIAILGSDVYIVGAAIINGKYCAAYWKNGNVTALSDEQNSVANAITVDGNDVYIAGYDGHFAAYWKNNKKVQLETTTPSTATAICIAGGSVYVAGNIPNTAAFWKDGVRRDLRSSALDTKVKMTEATGIAVSGKDVHISGYINLSYAAYWKNGVEIMLNNPMTNENITHNISNMVMYGHDIYICFNTASYWTNGSVINVTNGYATSIAVVPQ